MIIWLNLEKCRPNSYLIFKNNGLEDITWL